MTTVGETKGEAHLSPEAARRVFLILTTTRWLPLGFVVGILVLWLLERGLSLPETMTSMAVIGVVVLALELPTAGFADALGRRPVLIAAAVANVASMVALLFADSFAGFVVVAVLIGIFRALDSGPLEAWYVDTVHLTRPGVDVDQDLSRAATAVGATMAGGAVVSGWLVAWHPIGSFSALWLPILICAVLSVLHLLAVVGLLREPVVHLDSTGWSRAVDSVRRTPAVIGSGLALLRDNTVLRGLVLLECFWSTAMIGMENLTPVRLTELLGSEGQAGVIMGPLAAGAWAVFALGARISGWLSARWGVARAAIVARILHSLLSIGLALAIGPVGLVIAHLLAYTGHGLQGPTYNTLLHREASARNRATVLSMASMCGMGTFSLVMPLAGLLAEATSTQVAMGVTGALGLGGVWCLIPALRAERARATTVDAAVRTGPGHAS